LRPFGEIVSVFVCAQATLIVPMPYDAENRAQVLRLVSFYMSEDVSFGIAREL
jgi:hypothetical protein